MNRCFQARTLHSGVALLLTATFALAPVASFAQSSSSAATAQPAVRPFPSHALRAALVVTQTPSITIDGKPERLSPGARIYGANNMLVMSSALTGQPLLVNFVREPIGLVHQVWILTEAEARLPQALATPRPFYR